MKEIMIPEKQKIITAQELRQKGFTQYLIRKMLKANEIVKEGNTRAARYVLGKE